MTNDINQEDFAKIDASASLIAKEKFNIKKQVNKHFLVEPSSGQVYMIAFGNGEKNETNPKGFYAYWVWYFNEEPYGGLINCVLTDRYDSIDYFVSCMGNAEETIKTVINAKEENN